MYRVYNGGKIILRIDDNTWIPAVVGNRDYDEYLEWVKDGGVPEYDQSEP